ncbi:hypothetical protein [Pararhizobium sp. O133]|uniref:hypothetical protein n=1 Tax=Pararhizobium sp. O133 TaxID=3449278 RepID=UPI003F6835DC
MSAVNILVQRERVCLFTDTKTTNSDGVQFNIVKYSLLPWLRMVVAVRGHVGALRVFERSISAGAADYDSAVQYLIEHFKDVLVGEYLDPSEAYAVKQDVDVYIAGWGRLGPASHWISNYRASGQIQRIDGVHVSPMVDLEAQTRFAADVKTGMPRLMADQTQQNPGVGGWMMVTEVQENMILSYPHGGLDALSSVTSRMQTREEIEAFADIERRNAER